MTKYSFFLKTGKGIYGRGYTQLTVNDITLNYKEPEELNETPDIGEGLQLNSDTGAIELGGYINSPKAIVLRNTGGPVDTFLRIGSEIAGLRITRDSVISDSNFEVSKGSFNVNSFFNQTSSINTDNGFTEIKDVQRPNGYVSKVKVGRGAVELETDGKLSIKPGNFSTAKSTEGYVLTKVTSDGEAQWKPAPKASNPLEKKVLEITLNDSDFEFNASKPFTELIPASVNEIISIHHVFMAGSVANGPDQNNTKVHLAYHKPGMTRELLEVNTAVGKQLVSNSTDWGFNDTSSSMFFFDFLDNPIGAPLVLKGTDGIDTTGIRAIAKLRIEYSITDISEVVWKYS